MNDRDPMWCVARISLRIKDAQKKRKTFRKKKGKHIQNGEINIKTCFRTRKLTSSAHKVLAAASLQCILAALR